jgi:hypothetical protein
MKKTEGRKSRATVSLTNKRMIFLLLLITGLQLEYSVSGEVFTKLQFFLTSSVGKLIIKLHTLSSLIRSEIQNASKLSCRERRHKGTDQQK